MARPGPKHPIRLHRSFSALSGRGCMTPKQGMRARPPGSPAPLIGLNVMRTRILLVPIAAGALAMAAALPAGAAEGGSSATITVDTGVLAISVPATANLGTRTNTV